MVYAADSILQNAFAALVEEKDGGMLYQVEDCSYEDNLGICGWIRHRRVLLGNREMMMAHHVEGMPTKVRELEMTSGSQDVLYLSVSGVASTIHDGSFFGTARLLLEARSIKRAATTGLLLQVIAVILGLSICIGYILVNGYDNITSQTLLFFQLVMTGLTLLTTRLK